MSGPPEVAPPFNSFGALDSRKAFEQFYSDSDMDRIGDLPTNFLFLDDIKMRLEMIATLDNEGFDVSAFNHFDALDSDLFYRKVNASILAG